MIWAWWSEVLGFLDLLIDFADSFHFEHGGLSEDGYALGCSAMVCWCHGGLCSTCVEEEMKRKGKRIESLNDWVRVLERRVRNWGNTTSHNKQLLGFRIYRFFIYIIFKWRDRFGFGIGTEVSNHILVPVPAFGYRRKSEPESIPDQLEYYPLKLKRIWTGIHIYEFYCHV